LEREMSKFKLAYSNPAPIDVEFYYTYSLVRQINEDNENPEYETLMEIDHHIDENYNNQNHGLTSSDFQTFIDFAIPQEELDKVIEANNEEGERIINAIQKMKDEIIQKYEKYDYKSTCKSLYEDKKTEITNLMNNAIHPDELIDNTENYSQSFPINATLNFKNTLKETDLAGYISYGSYECTYNFTNAKVSKRNNTNTWKEICNQIKLEYPYSDYLNEEPYIVHNPEAIPYIIQLTSTSGYESQNGTGELAGGYEHESSISYDSSNLKRKWIDPVYGGINNSFENCYFLLMPANRSHAFYDLCNQLNRKSNYLGSSTYYYFPFEFIKTIDALFYSIGTIGQAIGLTFNNKINILENIKNNQNLENIKEIFNTTNYIKNSISDQNPLGLFKSNNKIYSMKICSKQFSMDKLMDKFPNIKIEESENGIKFIESEEENDLTYYDVYKLCLENKLESMFQLLFDFILKEDESLPTFISILINELESESLIDELNKIDLPGYMNNKNIDLYAMDTAFNEILRENGADSSIINRFNNSFIVEAFPYEYDDSYFEKTDYRSIV
jgi:hypothetical protein